MDALEIMKEMRDDVTDSLYKALNNLIEELEIPKDGRFVEHADAQWREYRSLLETMAAYDAAIEKIEDETK